MPTPTLTVPKPKRLSGQRLQAFGRQGRDVRTGTARSPRRDTGGQPHISNPAAPPPPERRSRTSELAVANPVARSVNNDAKVAESKQESKKLKSKAGITHIGNDSDAIKQNHDEWHTRVQQEHDEEVRRMMQLSLEQGKSIADLQLQADCLRRELDAKDEEIGGLRAQVENLTAANQSQQILEAEIAKLQSQVAAKEKETAGLTSRVSSMANKIINAEKKAKSFETKANEAGVLREEVGQLKAENADLKVKLEVAEAEADFANSELDCIANLEEENKELHMSVANAVKEFAEKDTLAEYYKEQAQKLEQDIKELQIWKTSGGDKAITSLQHSSRASMETIRGKGQMADAVVQTMSPKPSDIAQDLQITVNITEYDLPSHSSLLQRLRAAIPKSPGLDINGHPEIVSSLLRRMDAHSKDHESKTKRVEQQRKTLLAQMKEIAHLRQVLQGGECAVQAHRGLLDTISAKDSQIEMHISMLRAQEQALRRVEREGNAGC